jgi:two-component system sensor histidine kinase UhpB
MFIGFQPVAESILPFIVILVPVLGLLNVGVALALINKSPPKALRFIVVLVTCGLLPFAVVGTTLGKIISAGSAVIILIAGLVFATGLIAWSAFRQRNTDARLMLAPYFLMSWFAIWDVYVTATLPGHGFNLLVTYPRPLFLAFLTAVLMRRMGVSLDGLDRANETLSSKLAAQQAELAALHHQKRSKTATFVREHERQRLTHDLHDGISGHLVSIIALSERAGDKLIEQAAREALNDLRLVIYSLDLGDSELPLALANFRERLILQLQRLGVELDGSIAGLPEVTGVTPGNALAVLRILQEAITNALKHGPARKITIRGAKSADGMVAITLENDGRPFVENGRGHGLANMRRRAQQLRGTLDIESLDHGIRIKLLLPSSLPDFEDQALA